MASARPEGRSHVVHPGLHLTLRSAFSLCSLYPPAHHGPWLMSTPSESPGLRSTAPTRKSIPCQLPLMPLKPRSPRGPRGYHGLAGFLKGVGNPLFHEVAHKNAPSGLTWGSPPSGPGEVRAPPSRRRCWPCRPLPCPRWKLLSTRGLPPPPLGRHGCTPIVPGQAQAIASSTKPRGDAPATATQ